MLKKSLLTIIIISLSNVAFSSSNMYVYGAQCKEKTCSTPYTFYACCYMPYQQPNLLWIETPVMPLSYRSQDVACTVVQGTLPPGGNACNLNTPALLYNGKRAATIPSNYVITKIKFTWPPEPTFMWRAEKYKNFKASERLLQKKRAKDRIAGQTLSGGVVIIHQAVNTLQCGRFYE